MSESTADFPGIDFSLPAAGVLAAAHEIGMRCATVWVQAHGAQPLPAEVPAAIAHWSTRARAAWRKGLDAGLQTVGGAPSPSAAAVPQQGALVGYARVSTQDQTTAPQLDALRRAGCSRVFEETASGAQRDRPELAHALDYMRPGDTLVVWRLDRLARSLKQLIETVEALESRAIGFRSITEAIDTTTAGGRLVFHVFGALAEFERAMIRERTRAGLDAARARGRVGGRPRSLSQEDIEVARTLLSNQDITVDSVARRLGVSPSTLYRHLPGGRGALGE
jgi:DNA invertase Pin-like site-specific DNA recombinase